MVSAPVAGPATPRTVRFASQTAAPSRLVKPNAPNLSVPASATVIYAQSQVPTTIQMPDGRLLTVQSSFPVSATGSKTENPKQKMVRLESPSSPTPLPCVNSPRVQKIVVDSASGKSIAVAKAATVGAVPATTVGSAVSSLTAISGKASTAVSTESPTHVPGTDSGKASHVEGNVVMVVGLNTERGTTRNGVHSTEQASPQATFTSILDKSIALLRKTNFPGGTNQGADGVGDACGGVASPTAPHTQVTAHDAVEKQRLRYVSSQLKRVAGFWNLRLAGADTSI